jgi:hypothetical protein
MLPSSPASKYSIQGSKATDIEWFVSIALERLKIPYIFQYALLGGRTMRGGIVLDFLALTDPLSTPIDLRGDYWHQPKQRIEDDLGLALMMSRGSFAEPVILYGSELTSIEQAYSTVKRELRV